MGFEQKPLAPLSAIGSLTEIIEKPAERYGIELESGLTLAIIEDVHSTDALPLLAYALKALEDRVGLGAELTLDGYRAIGGVRGAIGAALRLVLSDPEPTPEEWRALRHAFAQLIAVDEGAVDSRRFLRRVADRANLRPAADRVLDRLVNARLLIAKEDGTIQLAHDRIIDNWPELPIRKWLDDDAESRKLIHQLNERKDDATLPKTLLSKAEALLREDPELANEEPDIGDLVTRCKRRNQLFWTTLCVILLVIVASIGWGLAKKNEAREQSLLAEIQQLVTEARVATESDKPDDIARGASLALESIEIARPSATFESTEIARPSATTETRSFLRSLLQKIETSSEGFIGALNRMFIGTTNVLPTADAVDIIRGALIHLPIRIVKSREPGDKGVLKGILALAALADGRLVSADGDKICIWSSDSNIPPECREGRRVSALAVLPDGGASGGQDGTVKIWSKDFTRTTGEYASGSPVNTLAVLKDGRIASGDDRGSIKIWPKGGWDCGPDQRDHKHCGQVRSLVALSDGRLASGGQDGNIIIWGLDAADQTTLRPQTRFSAGSPVSSLAALADGGLASGGADGTIKFWANDSWQLDGSFVHGGGVVHSLAVLTDGRLASGGNDNIKIWPKPRNKSSFVRPDPQVVLPLGKPVTVLSLTVLANGELASGDNLGSIKLWLLDEPETLSQQEPVLSLAVLKVGLAIVDGAGITIWANGKPTPLRDSDKAFSLAVLPNDDLVSGSEDGGIAVWPHNGRAKTTVLLAGQATPRVSALAALSDGRLVSGDKDGNIKLWQLQPAGTWHPKQTIAGLSAIQSLAVLGDGWLASGDINEVINIWRVGDTLNRDLSLIDDSRTLKSLVFKDRELAGGDDDGINFWRLDGGRDTKSFNLGKALPANVGETLSLAVLAEGRLVSGGQDGAIRIWLKGPGDARVVLSQGSPVKSLAVLADGRLASGGQDGTVKIWQLDEQKLIADLCVRLSAGQKTYIGLSNSWQPICRTLPSN